MFLTLIAVFRMVVLPVQFQDREFRVSRGELEAETAAAEAYFNRQFAGEREVRFELAPVRTLPKQLAYYGGNHAGQRDARLEEAVREACLLADADVDFSLYDPDGDGAVDGVLLLTPGPGEEESGKPDDLWSRKDELSAIGKAITLDGKRINRFAVLPQGRPGIFCHEIGHLLGLPDYYDTDGEDSGGKTPGLWDSALMDEGCKKDPAPDFNALDFNLLGIGQCDTLATGHYVLEPLITSRRYLYAPAGKKDEFFLFEARAGGLLVYHVDRSDNPAGFAPQYEAELSARERWEFGLVNNNPGHPCARLVPADPEAADFSRVPFPQPGLDCFGSDTPARFRSWSGRSGGLALTGIRPDGNGGVEFDVIAPIVLTDVTVYQDAALVRWSCDPSLGGIEGFDLRWTDGEDDFSAAAAPDAASFTLERLRPQTGYSFSVTVRISERERYSVSDRFVTKMYRGGSYPYIYLNNTTRNVDGTFPLGTRIPLRVFNATDVEQIRWFFDGVRIQADGDGGFTLRRSGLLKAEILHTDGTSELIVKQITVL